MTMQPDGVQVADLSAVVVPLLKGVIYRDADAAQWSALLDLQGRVRDYVAVLGLELSLDESEGYAFLRARPDPEAGARSESRVAARLSVRDTRVGSALKR